MFTADEIDDLLLDMMSYAKENYAVVKDDVYVEEMFCFRYKDSYIMCSEFSRGSFRLQSIDCKEWNEYRGFTWNDFITDKSLSNSVERGFEIKCKRCGGTNCEIVADGDYVYNGEDEVWTIYDYKMTCNDCGQES
jgi:hypothetical protein